MDIWLCSMKKAEYRGREFIRNICVLECFMHEEFLCMSRKDIAAYYLIPAKDLEDKYLSEYGLTKESLKKARTIEDVGDMLAKEMNNKDCFVMVEDDYARDAWEQYVRPMPENRCSTLKELITAANKAGDPRTYDEFITDVISPGYDAKNPAYAVVLLARLFVETGMSSRIDPVPGAIRKDRQEAASEEMNNSHEDKGKERPPKRVNAARSGADGFLSFGGGKPARMPKTSSISLLKVKLWKKDDTYKRIYVSTDISDNNYYEIQEKKWVLAEEVLERTNLNQFVIRLLNACDVETEGELIDKLKDKNGHKMDLRRKSEGIVW